MPSNTIHNDTLKLSLIILIISRAPVKETTSMMNVN